MKDIVDNGIGLEFSANTSTPDGEKKFTGYRIKSIELRNFGTYHGPATYFDMGCAGSVFAGANGTGKSTAFDGMKVTFAQNPRLNNAANAEGARNDRTIATYYSGIVGDEERSTGGIHKKSLRKFGDQEHTMGISVTFADAHGKTFTAMRLLYIDAAQKRNWRNITSFDELRLDRDFPRWETEGKLRSRGRANGFTLHQNYELMMGEVARVMGLRDAEQAIRAFKLLALAAGLQVLGTTTQFVREYILPDENFSAVAEDTLEAITNHGKARTKISMTRQQIEDLKRITSRMDALEEEHRNENRINRAADNVNLMSSYEAFVYSRHTRRHHLGKLAEAEALLASLTNEKASTEEEKATLDQLIHAQNGDRLDVLQENLDRTITSLRRVEDAQRAIIDLAAECGLKNISANAADWARIESHIAGSEKLRDDERQRQAAYDEARLDEGGARKAVKNLQDEIIAVEKEGSPLPRDLREARRDLAEALGVQPDDVPFLGELLQVEDKWRADWEAAANRVMGGQAVRILVPDALYPQALDFMEHSNADAHIRLERVRERDLDDDAASKARLALGKLPKDALANRIQIRKHEFEVYARAALAAHAPHLCVDGNEFSKTAGKTVTRKGSISHSDNSAEKDGRRRGHRQSFVLGWSVEDRLAALRAELTEEEKNLAGLAEITRQHEAGLKHARTKLRALEFLEREMKPWSEMDHGALQTQADKLKAELASIQTPDLQQLRDRRAACVQRVRDIESDINKRSVQVGHIKGSLETNLETMKHQRAQMDLARSNQEQGLTISEYRDIRARLVKITNPAPGHAHVFVRMFHSGGADLYNNRDHAFKELRQAYLTATETVKRSRNKIGQECVSLIDKYFDRYDGERGRGLSTNVRGNSSEGRFERQAWRERMAEIMDRDLPAAEEQAEKFRSSTLRTNIASLMARLTDYDARSRETIAGVNRILSKVIYNPSIGTYARIQIRRSTNRNIAEFDALLKNALDGHTDRSEDEQFKLYEEIAQFLRESDDGARQRKRDDIENLANRFDATIREVRVLPDGTDQLVQTIDSAGRLSGGEKERFSTFMMGVAINCAFNAHDEDLRDQCLHTILVDEAFGKSDAMTTAAAIDVLSAFDLQVIAATPMAKIRVFENVADTVFMVSRPNGMQTAISRMEMNTIEFSAAADDDSDLDGFKPAKEDA